MSRKASKESIASNTNEKSLVMISDIKASLSVSKSL